MGFSFLSHHDSPNQRLNNLTGLFQASLSWYQTTFYSRQGNQRDIPHNVYNLTLYVCSVYNPSVRRGKTYHRNIPLITHCISPAISIWKTLPPTFHPHIPPMLFTFHPPPYISPKNKNPPSRMRILKKEYMIDAWIEHATFSDSKSFPM